MAESTSSSTTDKNYLGYYDIVENWFTAENLKNYLDTHPIIDTYDVSRNLFNYPYSLMTSVDIPINTQVGLGRQFMEKISSNARILYVSPGSPVYAPKVSDKMKNAFKDVIKNGGDSTVLGLINNSQDEIKGKYFDFKEDYASYMLYVNGLCRALAIYLGLGDELGPDNKTPLKYYRWDNYKYAANRQGTKTANSVFAAADYEENVNEYGTSLFNSEKESDNNIVRDSLFGDLRYTQFYLDTNSTFSETYGNNLTDSVLKSKLNSISASAREILFLTQSGGVSLSGVQETVDKIGDTLKSTFSSLEGVIGRIADGATTIVNGAQMVFPSMWDSFSRDKSYSLSFYLCPPYGDQKTVYLESWVPLMHWMALCIPKQLGDNPNALGSPFLVKCFCKGVFSCQMGMVTSMVVDKTENVNANNLPARIKVTIYLRDLYDEFAISPSNKPFQIFNNVSMLEFLSVTAGLNMGTSNMIQRLGLLNLLVRGSIKDIPGNVYLKFMDNVRNVTRKIFGG